MELLEILIEIKGCGLYSPQAWEAYLDCFENADQLRKRVPAVPIPSQIPGRVVVGCATPTTSLDPSISPKIVSAGLWESQWRRNHPKIGIISGCFDLLHLGHVKSMEYAKALLDRQGPAALCVLTLSDEQIHAKKGNNRPVLNANERLRLITAIRYVDYTVLLDEPDCLSALARLKPDWYFKTSQDLERDIVRREAVLVESYGGSVEVFPDSISRITSTSELIACIGARFHPQQEPPS
jgi:D-beta-D-heptose 7-phosphate kinase/D-beta-D-heptose 1-phosphate adenosyltransferase